MKKMNPRIGKNVTLTLQNLENIMLYQNKTRKNFSQTLNVMLDQWDEYSLVIQKAQEKQEKIDLKEAEVIKNDKN